MFIPTKSYISNLTVQRAPHKTNYTVVQNELWDDNGLSMAARAVAHAILRKPQGWKVIPKEIGKVIGRCVDSVYKYLRELVDYGLLIRTRLKNKFGQWSGYSYVLVEPTRMGGNQISNPVSELVYSVSEKTVQGQSGYGKHLPLINTEINNSIDKEEKIDPLTKVDDVVISSSLINTEQSKVISEETIETTSSEPTQTESLVISKPLEKEDIPVACYKIKPIKSQNKDNITSTERCDYRAKLAAIGVAVQSVEWVIRQIPAQEREKVVASAIAWVSEQKWIEQPAAAFVNAVRTRKRSAAVVSEELRQIIDQNKSKSQQFSEWFDAGKIQGLVEQSVSHPEHYATVVITNRAVELLAQLQQEKEFAELERMTQSDRDERLAEMERIELAGEVTLPICDQPMPWENVRELLLCLTQK